MSGRTRANEGGTAGFARPSQGGRDFCLLGGVMELLDTASLMSRAERLGDGARLAALHPTAPTPGALVAVDLLEVEPGASTPTLQTAEEQLLYVLSGSGEIKGD